MDAARAAQDKSGVAWAAYQQNNGSQSQGAAQLSSVSLGNTAADLPQKAKDVIAANAQVARFADQYAALDAAASRAGSAARQARADLTSAQNNVSQAQATIATNSSGNNPNAASR